MKAINRALLAGISSLAFCAAPSVAFAQDVEIAEIDDYNQIIVTASKRQATLQETPIAVSVTTAEQIEDAQVRDLLDLQTLTPSLRVSQTSLSSVTNFIIRGFGNGGANPGSSRRSVFSLTACTDQGRRRRSPICRTCNALKS